MTDLRDAWRALCATPVVTTIAILSLALGIGANTAIFSIVNAVMLRALPVKEPQRLVQVMTGPMRTSWSNPLWEEMRARDHQLFDGASRTDPALQPRGRRRGPAGARDHGERAMFDLLGVPGDPRSRSRRTTTFAGRRARAAAGRGHRLQLLAAALRRRPDVSARRDAELVPFTIIGVTPPGFEGLDQGNAYDVAIPLGAEPLMRGPNESAMDQRTNWWMRVIAASNLASRRCRGGGAARHAAADAGSDASGLRRRRDLPNYLKDPLGVRPAANGPASLGRQYRQPLFVIMASSRSCS